MVPPPRGTSSGLVSPEEEQDDVEDMASPRGSRDREDAALSFSWPLERERGSERRPHLEPGRRGKQK